MAYTTINKPSDYFNTKLYTGDGTSSHAITGVGFAPDFVWSKARNGVNAHILVDKVRGATKVLHSNATTAEQTCNANQDMISLDSDGFTVGTPTQFLGTNTNGRTVASWNWLANGAGSANTDGSISSTVSANTTSGFSIVSYTGTNVDNTVGHGLGVEPKMIIVKELNSASYGWVVYHSSLGNNQQLELNTTGAVSGATGWQNTSPTSTVFSIDNAANSLNKSGSQYIAYCFASKQGYSRFTTYNGANSNDGAFLYLGFKPSFLMVKAVSGSNTPASQPWTILDNKRSSTNGNNVIGYKLFPNSADAENTDGNNHVDFLSNGVKFRGGNDATNGNNLYIVMAFAEAPLVGTNNVPCTAR